MKFLKSLEHGFNVEDFIAPLIWRRVAGETWQSSSKIPENATAEFHNKKLLTAI